MNIPFSEIIRPSNIDDVVGQSHIIGKGKLINRIIETGKATNLILYGPPGTGKTTVSSIIAKNSDMTKYKLNATYSNTQDIRNITDAMHGLDGINGVLVELDEIQNFNKKQQQLFLEHIERGKMVLIACTTDNPYHHVYGSLLSRCTVLKFFPLKDSDIKQGVLNALNKLEIAGYKIKIEDKEILSIVNFSGGDLRKALNILGTAVNLYSDKNKVLDINENLLSEVSGEKIIAYDLNGDEHYDLLSAFQKSIRGSDPDAALHYLARLLAAGDLISPCRRLSVIASEDVGLAYPQAASIVFSCIKSAEYLGLPEARLPLAEAVILLATSPKSNSVITAIDSAMQDLNNFSSYEIPDFLKDAHYSGAKKLNHGTSYKYPHDYPMSYVKQNYMPKTLKNRKYYTPKENKMENAIKNHMENLKKSDL